MVFRDRTTFDCKNGKWSYDPRHGSTVEPRLQQTGARLKKRRKSLETFSKQLETRVDFSYLFDLKTLKSPDSEE
jgi:hypothetical protein